MQPMTIVKVAVIGLGNMGKHHVRNYHNIKNAKLVAVCDLQQSIVDEFSEQCGCHGYTSLDEMLDSEDIDMDGIAD